MKKAKTILNDCARMSISPEFARTLCVLLMV